jgi:hypothetical protein
MGLLMRSRMGTSIPPASALQRADPRGVTAAAGLCVGHGALPLTSCCLIVVWSRPVLWPRHPHRRSSPRIGSHVSLLLPHVIGERRARVGGEDDACGTARDESRPPGARG